MQVAYKKMALFYIHKSDVKKIAEGFGFTAKVVSDHQKFENEFIDFFQNDITQILIFKTNRKENPLALNRLFKFLKNASILQKFKKSIQS